MLDSYAKNTSNSIIIKSQFFFTSKRHISASIFAQSCMFWKVFILVFWMSFWHFRWISSYFQWFKLRRQKGNTCPKTHVFQVIETLDLFAKFHNVIFQCFLPSKVSTKSCVLAGTNWDFKPMVLISPNVCFPELVWWIMPYLCNMINWTKQNMSSPT